MRKVSGNSIVEVLNIESLVKGFEKMGKFAFFLYTSYIFS